MRIDQYRAQLKSRSSVRSRNKSAVRSAMR